MIPWDDKPNDYCTDAVSISESLLGAWHRVRGASWMQRFRMHMVNNVRAELWFAWFPVVLETGGRRWLCRVRRYRWLYWQGFSYTYRRWWR